MVSALVYVGLGFLAFMVAASWTSSNEDRGVPPRGYNPSAGWTPGPDVVAHGQLQFITNLAVVIILSSLGVVFEWFLEVRNV